ncbi:resuscitation-promoting factor RpfC [Mycobacterium leprae]|nr:transglycosylase family protein [Mycobacterium leprae]OAR20784.1 Resuscitation-promoting factor RpfC [Mycobacterium leprae 3125609]OAX71987.1 Resuscitation-promoting factor RpfC [Mycobacterium leprae 7935681]
MPGEMLDVRKLCKLFVKSAVVSGIVTASMALSTSTGMANAVPREPNWDAVAQCESGRNWRANTGNGFYGGLQFKPTIWARYGGVGNPAGASREQQITVANRVLADQGLDAWPKCGAASDLPITLWSHPAQGVKQIINDIIQMGDTTLAAIALNGL